MSDYVLDGLSASERIRRYEERKSWTPSEGDFVAWDGGEGVIEHVMFDGVLGEYGGDWALPASKTGPAALVRVYEGGMPSEFMVGKRVADLKPG